MKLLYYYIILHLKNVRIKTFHDRFVESLRRQKNLGLKLNKDFLKLKQAMFGMKINYASVENKQCLLASFCILIFCFT